MAPIKNIFMALLTLLLLSCSGLAGSGGANGGASKQGGAVGEVPPPGQTENQDVGAPPPEEDATSIADSGNPFGGFQNFANHPLDSGSATLDKDVEHKTLGIAKAEVCTLLNGKVRLSITGQVPNDGSIGDDIDGWVVRLVESEQNKSIDTLTHTVTKDFKTMIKITRGVFSFELVTEPDFPVKLYLMKKDFHPKILDTLVDLDPGRIWVKYIFESGKIPVSTWLAKAEDDGSYKVGPCAVHDLPNLSIPFTGTTTTTNTINTNNSN